MAEEEINIKKILVPIDGSDASLKAAKYAITAAKFEKARIICIYVIPAPENISEFEGKPFYSHQAYYDELGKSAKPWFEKIIETGKVTESRKNEVIWAKFIYSCSCYNTNLTHTISTIPWQYKLQTT